MYTQLDILSFERIAFAHTLVQENYHHRQDNMGYGIYGKSPEDGGILEVGFVEQTPLELRCGNGSFLLEENSIFIIPPNCSFTVNGKSDGLHRHTSVEFLIRCRTEAVEGYQPPNERQITLPMIIPPSQENKDIFAQIRSIVLAHTAQPMRSYFEECAEFMWLLHLISRRLQDSCSDGVTPGNIRHCERAVAYIANNIHKPIRVYDVAAAVGVSKNYLTNVFSSCQGVSMIEYINRRKLTHMLELIRRYGYTLAEAGSHVGYTDVNYISRLFKKFYGMNITEYKRKYFNQEE